MHTAFTKWRFKQGDRVLCLRAPEKGEGEVLFVGVESTVIYLGKNEWLTEHVTFAQVQFNDRNEMLRLNDIISVKQVELYDSLRPGDFIVFGSKKNAKGIVLSSELRQSRRPYAVKNTVIVLENGTKRNLSIRFEVIKIQKVDDV